MRQDDGWAAVGRAASARKRVIQTRTHQLPPGVVCALAAGELTRQDYEAVQQFAAYLRTRPDRRPRPCQRG